MVKTASIGVVTLAVAAPPANAGHEAIGLFDWDEWRSALGASSQQQSLDTLRQHGSALAYEDYAEGVGRLGGFVAVLAARKSAHGRVSRK